ncbi:MAG: CHAT domain-containing protein [Blastocatellia bacterium]|nr:CHAT domain-containing protein [Blastocatellia bacterium]
MCYRILPIVRVGLVSRIFPLGSLLLWLGFAPAPVAPFSLPVFQSSGNGTSVQEPQTERLEPGKIIQRELKGGESHSYQVSLATGQYLHVVVEQKGIDVVASVIGPSGERLAEVDSPNLNQGFEPLFLVAPTDGAYRIHINSLDKAAPLGRYEVQIKTLRAASPPDRDRFSAQKMVRAAEELAEKRNPAVFPKAIEQYEAALALWQATGERDREAFALYALGVLYFTAGKAQQSQESILRALPHFRSLGEHNAEALALNKLGGTYSFLGERRKALETYEQGRKIWHEQSNFHEEAVSLNNIGKVYTDLGELQKALDTYEQALTSLKKQNNQDMEPTLLTNLGYTFFRLGDQNKALEYFTTALSAMKKAGSVEGEIAVLNNLIFIYDERKEKEKALECAEQALQKTKAIGDRRREAGLLNNIAARYFNIEDFEKALPYLTQALEIRQAIGDRAGEATTLTNLGRYYSYKKETEKAIEFYLRALQLRKTVGDRDGESKTLYTLAQDLRDLGRLGEARSRIEAAVKIVETTRAEVVRQDLRASYFATIQGYYSFYVSLLMEMHQQQPTAGWNLEAFQVGERARARCLLELLAESRVNLRQGVATHLPEQEKTLSQQIASKGELLLKTVQGQKEPTVALEKEIATLTTQLEQVRAEIRRTSPGYAALTQPQPVGIKEAQEQLDSETVLLEFLLGEPQSYLWVVTRQETRSYELPSRKEIETAVRRLYKLLTIHQVRNGASKSEHLTLTQSADQAYWTEAAQLSRQILGPAASQLGTKRLLIVADGALHFLPFAALPVPDNKTGTGTKTKKPASQARARTTSAPHPLILDHEIVLLPSASTLTVLRQQPTNRTPAPQTVAVLADPVFESSDPRIHQQARTKPAPAGAPVQEFKPASASPPDPERDIVLGQFKERLTETQLAESELMIPRLPATRQEAQDIAALVPASDRLTALDFAANRELVTSGRLADYQVVHIATHGLVNARHPELSGLVLSLVDQQGQPHDGFLQLSDIFNLKLSAELVVLSACQTALGKEIKGEGLVGLTRGFMYAGTPRVVASLWAVQDAATAELMYGFYQHMLKNNERPAAALRAAQIALWQKAPKQSPYFWAAFIMQGEWK